MGNRLTRKDEKYYRIAEPYINWTNGVQRVVNKLGQLEDIEEELGINLITLFEVLGNGLYYKTDYGTIEFVNIDRLTFVEGINEWAFEKINGCQCGTNSSGQSWWALNRELFLLKYYGTTWALTKEELEVENYGTK